MEPYRQQVLDILEKQTGYRNVMSLEYNDINENTSKDDLDFALTIGNISLMDERVITPVDAAKEKRSFLALQLP
jgi:hypothetical protein